MIAGGRVAFLSIQGYIDDVNVMNSLLENWFGFSGEGWVSRLFVECVGCASLRVDFQLILWVAWVCLFFGVSILMFWLESSLVWKAGGQVFLHMSLQWSRLLHIYFQITCWQALQKHLQIQQGGTLPTSWTLVMDLSLTSIQQQDMLVWRPLGVATAWLWWDEPTQSLPLMD